MKFLKIVSTALLAASAIAFPVMRFDDPKWVSNLERRLAENPHLVEQAVAIARDAADKTKYPGVDNDPVLTPDPNDKEHEFRPPGKTDQRGPCPGMNALANHGYVPRTGIVSMQDLVEGQKNMFNVGKDLGAFLALVATTLDGDLTTGMLSLGGRDDRTLPLGPVQGLLSDEGGLVAHDHFEGDASLTREDYYMHNGDDYTFKPAKFAKMLEFVEKYSTHNGRFDFDSMGMYRWYLYNQSLADNDKFVFIPQHLLLYGAASFVYEMYVNGTDKLGSADVDSVASFFGAVRDKSAPHGWRAQPERAPPNWYRRGTEYSLDSVGGQMFDMYFTYPVPFGYRAGNSSTFIKMDNPWSAITPPTSPEDMTRLCCDLFQVGLSLMPAEVRSLPALLGNRLQFLLGGLVPLFKDSCGCGDVEGPGTTHSTPDDVQQRKAGADLMSQLLGKVL